MALSGQSDLEAQYIFKFKPKLNVFVISSLELSNVTHYPYSRNRNVTLTSFGLINVYQGNEIYIYIN